jgi:hypothetical protein
LVYEEIDRFPSSSAAFVSTRRVNSGENWRKLNQIEAKLDEAIASIRAHRKAVKL